MTDFAFRFGLNPGETDLAKTGDGMSPSAETLRQQPRGSRSSVKPLLDTIRHGEAGGNYNAIFGNSKGIGDLSQLSVGQVMQLQRDMVRKGSPSSAIGGYQFIRGTLKGLVSKLKIDPNTRFTPELQDYLAEELVNQRGFREYRTGRISQEKFANNLAMEWAALPTSTGRSHYAGDGLNASRIDRGTLLKALSSSGTASMNVPGQYARTFEETGDRYGVDPDILAGIGYESSAFNPLAIGAETPAGKRRGLMGFPPSQLDVFGVDPTDANSQIDGTGRFLRDATKQYQDPRLAIAAYQWGTDNVDAWLAAGADPSKMPADTRQFVDRVLGHAAGGMGNPDFERDSGILAANGEIDRQYADLEAKTPGRYKVMDAEEAAAWKKQWDAENQSSGILGDTGRLLTAGNAGLGLAVREGFRQAFGDAFVEKVDAIDEWVTGSNPAERMERVTEQARATMTPAQRAASDKKWWNSESGTLGDAWADPRSYYGGVVESLPGTVATMLPGMWMARGAYAAKVAAGASPALASAAAARTAAIAGGLLEGFQGGGDSARNVRTEIEKLDIRVLRQSEAFQALTKQGMTEAQARKAMAEDAATQAFVMAGLVTSVFGGRGDAAIVKIFGEGVSGTIGKRIAKGAGKGVIGEGLLEELPQGVGSTIGENYAKTDAIPNQDLTEGVGEAAASGIAIGGAMGAGFGSLGGAARPRSSEAAQASDADEKIAPAATAKPAPTSAPGTPADRPTPGLGPLGRALEHGQKVAQPVGEGALPEGEGASVAPAPAPPSPSPEANEARFPIGATVRVEDPEVPSFEARVEGYADGEVVIADVATGEVFQVPFDIVQPVGLPEAAPVAVDIVTPEQARAEGLKDRPAPAGAAAKPAPAAVMDVLDRPSGKPTGETVIVVDDQTGVAAGMVKVATESGGETVIGNRMLAPKAAPPAPDARPAKGLDTETSDAITLGTELGIIEDIEALAAEGVPAAEIATRLFPKVASKLGKEAFGANPHEEVALLVRQILPGLSVKKKPTVRDRLEEQRRAQSTTPTRPETSPIDLSSVEAINKRLAFLTAQARVSGWTPLLRKERDDANYALREIQGTPDEATAWDVTMSPTDRQTALDRAEVKRTPAIKWDQFSDTIRERLRPFLQTERAPKAGEDQKGPEPKADVGDEALAAAQAAKKKPGAAPAPSPRLIAAEGFTTAKGSTYTIDENGKTTRDKAARPDPGHEGDSGLKPKSARTIYLDTNASVLSGAGLSNEDGKGFHVIINDTQDKASMVWWNPVAKRWGPSASSKDIPFHDEPAIGRYPLELWKPTTQFGDAEAYSGQHAGNAITEIRMPKPDAGRLTTEELDEAVGDPRLKAAEAHEPSQAEFDAAKRDNDAIDALFPAARAPEPKQSPSIDAAAHEAATSPKNDRPEPTQAQKEAGNYKLGHVNLGGLEISIENPAGSERMGIDPNGKKWSVQMKSHYGYIRKTEGTDGDHVDVFVKPGTDALADDAPIFIIDQVSPNGVFDEHKVMIGWKTGADARVAYMQNYAKGWKGLGAINQDTLAGFKLWLENGDTSLPYSMDVDGKPATGIKLKPLTAPDGKAFAPRKLDTFDPVEAKGEGWGDTHIFPAPAKTHDAAKNADLITPAEAAKRLARWKEIAKQIGRTKDNSKKVIISLFDASGSWSQPWRDAGYAVIQFDAQLGDDIFADSPQHIMDQVEEIGGKVFGILAATPCTTFAGSGARWWKDRHDTPDPEMVAKLFGPTAAKAFDTPVEANIWMVNMTGLYVDLAKPEAFHVLENPIGRIGEMSGLPAPLMRFDPADFGDAYTKRTQLWGSFDPDLPLAPVDPVEGSKMQNKLRGDNPADKAARSKTPEGFAYSFFMANDPDARAMLNEQPAATEQPAAAPVHPGLVIKSMTGKETRIQPAGTVAPEPPAPKTVEIAEDGAWAKGYADDVAGTVAYIDGDLALIEGYSVMSGTPVYAAAKKGQGKTKVDVDAFTGTAFTPAEIAKLRAVKKGIVAADEKNAAANPDGPFASGGRVIGGASVDPDLVATAKSLLDLLNLDVRVFIAHPDDVRAPDAVAKLGLYGVYGAVRAVVLTKAGGVRRLPNGDYVMSLQPQARKSMSIETIAHEIGHILETEALNKAPAATRAALVNAHQAWLAENTGKRAPEYVTALRNYISGRRTVVTTDSAVADLPPYWRSFSEWFADQVSKWATTEPAPNDAIGQFFRKIAESYRKMIAKLQARGSVPVAEVRDFLNARVAAEKARATAADATTKTVPNNARGNAQAPVSKPKKAKTPPFLDRMENFYRPGRDVGSYFGKDRVIAFARDGIVPGGWSVQVREIRPDGSLGDLRTHSTAPNTRELVAWEKENPVPEESTQKKSTQPDNSASISAPPRRRHGDPDYSLLDARNDLIQMRAELEGQAVQDDRLRSRVEQQAALVKAMERDASAAATPASKPGKEWKQIGTNADGNPVSEDERGVRSYVRDGVRISESVAIGPDGTVRRTGREHPEFTVVPVGSAPAKPAYGANNKLVSADRAAELRARLRDKLKNQASSGIDPEIMAMGAELAAFHLEAGAREFITFARAIANDLETSVDKLRPYLRAWYNSARDLLEDHDLDVADMDSPETVRAKLKQLKEAPSDEPGQLARDGDSRREGAEPEPVPGTEGQRETERDGGGERGADVPADDAAGGKRPRSGGSVRSGSGGQPVSEPAGGVTNPKAAADAVEQTEPKSAAGTRAAQQATNYTLTDADEIGAGGPKAKFRANVAAVRLVKQLEAEGRAATREEQAVLAKFVGWGGLQTAFPRENGSTAKGWEKEAAELRELLEPEEYRAAESSTRNAHYTSPAIVNAVWSAVQRLGFTGGRVLEPSVGTGNFFGFMPAGVRTGSQLTGVELDPTTGAIAKHLYPQADIHPGIGFEKLTTPDGHFDLAIGNPPFGSERLYDPARKALNKFSIHNFFFAKSLDALRPNGVLAMVVTSNMMDTAKDAARQYLMARSELLGAVRLPNNAFLDNAGTEVTTDIIFLRKLEKGEKATGESWSEIRQHKGADGVAVPLNEYFARHPENMLGDFGAYGTMYGPDQPALVAKPGQDTPALLRAALASLPANIMSGQTETRLDVPEQVATNVSDALPGSAFLDANGIIHVRGEDILGRPTSSPAVFANKKAADRAAGMIRVRDVYTRLRKAQLDESATDEQIARLRERLNKVYDTFVAEFGPISQEANQRVFRDDPTYPQIAALEEGYDKGISAAISAKTGEKPREPSARKAAVFTKRTQSPFRPVTSASTAKDALMASLAERNRIDMDRMQELYGKSADEITRELGELIYRLPDGSYETTDAYLSGNVKRKLAEAKQAAATDPAFRRNVEALEDVIPADIAAVDIKVKPGAPWVPTETIQAFIDAIGDTSGSKAFYSRGNARWDIDMAKPGIAAEARFTIPEVRLATLVENVLNGQATTVYTKNANGDPVVDVGKTETAAEKAALIKDEWDRWLWLEDDRREMLHRLYNDTFNTNVERVFDGSHLSFPGKVSDDILDLRPHQKNAIWRALQSPTVLLDHTVGAGKTFTVIGEIMEKRRLGLARKPLLVVPNHLVVQWATSFLQLYPGAKILAAGKADFEAANRKKLFSRIATGDWDAVIVGHSSFGKVKVSPEYERQFIQAQLDDLEISIAEVKRATGDKSRNVKQLTKWRDAQKAKLQALHDQGGKDEGLTFEEMGIDHLAVDELHEFKNLGFSTSMQRIAGLGNTAGSQRAADLFMKVTSVLDRTGGRNFTGATGTPLSNTMAEMYTMQRYLGYSSLKALGLAHFDAWARTFGEVVTDWELSPSGKYKQVSRFSKFINMPELMQQYRAFGDVITNDEIKRQLAERGQTLPIPKVKNGKPTDIIIPRTTDQAHYIGEARVDNHGNETYREGSIVWRAENLPKKAEKGADNMLKVMGDARKAALDMRLIDPALGDDPGNKVNAVRKEVNRIYRQWHAQKGTQLVFIDLSTPGKAREKEALAIRDLIAKAEDGDEAAQEKLDNMSPDEFEALNSKFSVYDALKAKLIEDGIPEHEIAFIHDANTDPQKAELFAKVRSGRVRILFGSTAKMGAGTNVQDRMVALHHVDAPWRPSDLEQRDGRVIRQGNRLYEQDPEGFEVEILRYAQANTLDARMWQTIESKARFIEQVRNGSSTEREVEDVAGAAASAAEIKAAASGNPLIAEEIALRDKIRKLDRARTEHEREQHRIRDAIRGIDKTVERIDRDMPALTADAATAKEAAAAKTVTIHGTTYDKVGDIGRTILTQAKEMEKSGDLERTIGTAGGFTLKLEQGRGLSFSATLVGQLDHGTWIDDMDVADNVGTGMRLMNTLRGMEKDVEAAEGRKATARSDRPKLEAQLGVWKSETEWQAAKARHAFVLNELKPKPKVAPEAAPDTNAEPGDGPEPMRGGDLAERLARNLGGLASSMPSSSAFKKWFGNSKVVDDKGHPLVVYHGTYADIEGDFAFELGGQRSGQDTPSHGFYFADSLAVAKDYVPGGDVVSAFLSIESPLDLRTQAHVDALNAAIESRDLDPDIVSGQWPSKGLTTENLWAQIEDMDAPNRFMNGVIEWSKEAGFDGLIHGDYRDGAASTSYVAFEPAQIKSATNNSGAFDPANPSIVADTNPAASLGAPLSSAERTDIEAKVSAIVARVAGRDVEVEIFDTIPIDDFQGESRDQVERARTEAGEGLPATMGGIAYMASAGQALIKLAVSDPLYDAVDSAYHEAYHRVEIQLMTEAEFAFMRRPDVMAKLLDMAAKAYGMATPSAELRALPDYEIRAIAFAAFAAARERGVPLYGTERGLLPAVARLFERFRRMLADIKAVLTGNKSPDLIQFLEGIRTGSHAGRQPGFRNVVNTENELDTDVVDDRPAPATRAASVRLAKSTPNIDAPAATRRALQEIKGKLTDITPKVLAAIPLNYFSELARPNMTAVGDYLRMKRRLDSYRGIKHAAADEIAQRWMKLKPDQMRRVADLMHESTLAEIDPTTNDDDIKLRVRYPEIRGKWDELTPAEKEVYTTVRDTYRKQAAELDQILLDNIRKSMEAAGRAAYRRYKQEAQEIRDSKLPIEEKQMLEAEAAARLAKAQKKTEWSIRARLSSMRQNFEKNRVPAPYFPLARFGDYFVTVRNKDGSVDSFSRRESAAEADRLAEEMRKAFPGAKVETGVLTKNDDLHRAMDPRLLAEIEEIIGEHAIDDGIMDEIWQRYLQGLPDLSTRKRFIHRKGTPGYSGDALRAFGNHMFHAAHQMGKLKYGGDMKELVEVVSEQADATGGTDKDKRAAKFLSNELRLRHGWVMNPKGGSVAHFLSSLAFTWYLAMTPAAAIVNLSQTTIVGIPILGTRFGMAKATAALARAVADVAQGRGFGEQSARLSAEEKRVMRDFYETGLVDRTQSHDLAGIGDTGQEYRPMRAKVMAKISFLFHHAERLNREVTALASYRLARDSGQNMQTALETAHTLTWKTHFDYSNSSRPRIMQGDFQRVLFTFRNFQINMLYRLFRDIHQSFQGDTAAARKEARAQLVGLIGMMALHAGVRGMPFFGIAMAILSMAFGDDDDPFDAEEKLKGAVIDTLGPQLGGVLLNGVPGHVLGVDLVNRIGMPNLWFQSAGRDLDGADEYNHWVNQMLGAVPGLAQNGFRGVSMMADGNVWRGIETVAPKQVKDLMKSYRYWNEGALTLRGDAYAGPDDISTWNVIGQALGFTPAVLVETYERNDALKNAEKRIVGRRRQLLNRFAAARSLGDTEAMKEVLGEIQAFNQVPINRAVKITKKTIKLSLKARERNSGKMKDGVMIQNPDLGETLRRELPATVYR